MTSTRHSTAAWTGISSVITTADGFALTAPARLCFIVEERYENDVMPGAVIDVLRSWGHHVDVLAPNGMLADLRELIPTYSPKYDAYRAIRLARDKAVAAVRGATARTATTLTFTPVQEATA